MFRTVKTCVYRSTTRIYASYIYARLAHVLFSFFSRTYIINLTIPPAPGFFAAVVVFAHCVSMKQAIIHTLHKYIIPRLTPRDKRAVQNYHMVQFL